MFLTDMHSLGLDIAQGIALTESFYWDLNDGTRAFSDRFIGAMPGGARRPWCRRACIPARCTT